MSLITLVEAIRQSLDEEMDRDESVILIGQDIGPRGGIFRVTDGLYEKYGPQRVIDAPLSTEALVGASIGAAMFGLKPICEIQFADFIHPAFNQLVNEAAKIYYRSGGEWTVPLVIRAPYGGGTGGGLYHSQSVEAFFSHVPGLKIVVPSNPYDARGLLKSALCDPNPVLFFEPKMGYRMIEGEVPKGQYTIPLGMASISRQGSDLSAFTYGMMHEYTLAAAELAAQEGIDIEVVDLRTLYPLDTQTILASLHKTGKALIVHEDNRSGGIGAEIAASLASEGFTDLDAPVMRLAAPDLPAVPYSPSLQEWYMLSPEKIMAAIRELADY